MVPFAVLQTLSEFRTKHGVHGWKKSLYELWSLVLREEKEIATGPLVEAMKFIRLDELSSFDLDAALQGHAQLLHADRYPEGCVNLCNYCKKRLGLSVVREE